MNLLITLLGIFTCLKIGAVNSSDSEPITSREQVSQAEVHDEKPVTVIEKTLNIRKANIHKFDSKVEKNIHKQLYVLVCGGNEQIMNSTKTMLKKIVDEIKSLNDSVSLGFGLYYDKPFRPIITSGRDPNRDYEFKHILSITDDFNQVEETITTLHKHKTQETVTQGAGLDAVAHASLCYEQIGWNDESSKIIWLHQLNMSYTAGDAWRMAIVRRFNRKCLLKSDNTLAAFYDYIDWYTLRELMADRKINFLTTWSGSSDLKKETSELNKFMDGVSTEFDQSKVGSLLRDAFEKFIKRIFNVDKIINDVNYKIYLTPYCRTYEIKRKNFYLAEEPCGKVGSTVHWTILMVPKSCSKKGKIQRYYIKLISLGLIELKLSTPCDGKENSHLVSDDSKAQEKTNSYNSKASNSSTMCIDKSKSEKKICSGFGECIDNKCVCAHDEVNENLITGKYCECDNRDYQTGENEFCSGKKQGILGCGLCKCNQGYDGDRCEIKNCVFLKDKCPKDANNRMCSGLGKCECGQCTCNYGYSGENCEIRETNDLCNLHVECVACKLFASKNKSSCGTCSKLLNYTLEKSKNQHKTYHCQIYHDKCVLFYDIVKANEHALPRISIKSYERGDCAEHINSTSILVAIFFAVSTVLIGVPSLIICIRRKNKGYHILENVGDDDSTLAEETRSMVSNNRSSQDDDTLIA